MNGKLFIGTIHVQNRNIAGDNVRNLAYDMPERNFSERFKHRHRRDRPPKGFKSLSQVDLTINLR